MNEDFREEMEKRLAVLEAYNAALVTAVQTLATLIPNQASTRNAMADALERLIATALARSGQSDLHIETLQALRATLVPRADRL